MTRGSNAVGSLPVTTTRRIMATKARRRPKRFPKTHSRLRSLSSGCSRSATNPSWCPSGAASSAASFGGSTKPTRRPARISHRRLCCTATNSCDAWTATARPPCEPAATRPRRLATQLFGLNTSAYLGPAEIEAQRAAPDLYAAFLAQRERTRQTMTGGLFHASAETLTRFDSNESRHLALAEFCCNQGSSLLLDFDSWCNQRSSLTKSASPSSSDEKVVRFSHQPTTGEMKRVL